MTEFRKESRREGQGKNLERSEVKKVWERKDKEVGETAGDSWLGSQGIDGKSQRSHLVIPSEQHTVALCHILQQADQCLQITRLHNIRLRHSQTSIT